MLKDRLKCSLRRDKGVKLCQELSVKFCQELNQKEVAMLNEGKVKDIFEKWQGRPEPLRKAISGLTRCKIK